MKIFLDVGAHCGQTLEEVIRDNYHFDIIHCFEPMPGEYERLREKFKTWPSSEKIIFHNYGLLDRTTSLELYGTNTDMGASIFPNKNRMQGREKATTCKFVRASEFFAENIKESDVVVMKLNVEGSECIILNDLLDTRECFKIDNVMIDFDIRKVPDKQNDELVLLERFKKEGFTNYSLCENVMKGKGRTHQKRIRSWLSHLAFASDFMELSRTQKIKKFLKMVYWKTKHDPVY